MSSKWGVVGAALVALAGCAGTARSFGDTRTLARGRTGFDVAYRPADLDAPEAASVDIETRRLLAEPLGPNEAIRIALARSPDLQAAFEELGIARADLLTASLPPNLEFDLEARLRRRQGPGDEVESHVVIDVTDLVTMPLRRAAARAELEAAQIDAAEAVLDVAYAVRAAYVEHIAALRLLETMREVVAAARAAFELADAQYEAGNVARLDTTTREAMYEESRLWLAEAELEGLQTRERLLRVMGLPGESSGFEVAMRLDDPSENELALEGLEGRAVESSLHLSAERFELEAIARRRGVARVEGVMPHLSAGVSGSLADRSAAFGPAVMVGVPLWNQGQGVTRRYEAELRVGWRRYESESLTLRSAVRRARNRLQSARERTLLLRDTLLPLRARVVRETVLQYNAMQATPYQVLEARRDEIETMRSYLRVLREYWLARAALVHLLAGGRVDPDAAASAHSDETGHAP